MLARGVTVIRHPSLSNDSLSALGMARALGAQVRSESDSFIVASGQLPAAPVALNCGESGLALRMFAPVSALLCNSVTLAGEGSLLQRPVTMISEALPQFGVAVTTSNGRLPVILNGRLTGGSAVIDGSTGSQLLTGLLMALPLTASDSRIEVIDLASRPYIDLTLGLLENFGIEVRNEGYSLFAIRGGQSYRAGEYSVEGDWSGAAFLLVAGATGGRVGISNLSRQSRQADRLILRALQEAGAAVGDDHGGITAAAAGLRAFSLDATDSPDLFPPLAALAASCKGTSIIRGVSRLRHKESDRAEAITDVLSAMKVVTGLHGDEMYITGGKVQGAVVSSHNDHRIAMMAAVMATVAEGPVTITGAEAVSKSYPEFYDHLGQLGVQVSRQE